MRTVTHRLAPVLTIAIVSLHPGWNIRPEPAQASAPRAEVGYVTNIERATLDNEDYRRVLFTAGHTQLVLMSLRPGEEIGQERHEDVDQFIRVEGGTGRVIMNGDAHPVEDGTAVVIPAGATHNLVNTGASPLQLYTLYSPPEHAPGTVHRTKREAEAARRTH